MKVAIHQPQYIPWLPYFCKIDECDLFIFLDSVDFQKNGLQNRNQIKTAQGAQWLTVPVRHRLGQKINEIGIEDGSGWRRKHWQTLRQAYGKAAAFANYEAELAAVFEKPWARLSDLNIEITAMMMRWMGISTPTATSSTMQAKGTASDLVLNLCLEAGATHYVSGTGGLNYLDADAFAAAGVGLDFRPAVFPGTYPQQHQRAGFLNDLSAVDIVLNCGPDWRHYLPEEATAK